MASPAIPVAAAAPAAPDSIKVFIANLPFSVAEAQLQKSFTDAGVKVVDVKIIRRARRSMGYGFIGVADQANATLAVSKFNGTKMGDRELKVEVAAPRDPAKEAEAAAKKAAAKPAKAEQKEQKEGGKAGDKKAAAAAAPGQDDKKKGVPAGGPASAVNKGGRGAPRKRASSSASNADAPKSKTIVFVANLPYTVDDEALKAFFTGLNVVSSHVVLLKPRGNMPQRSAGYGFVEFASNVDQLKALEHNGKAHAGREISVSAAKEEAPKQPATPAAVPAAAGK